jgi:hypothetical protein
MARVCPPAQGCREIEVGGTRYRVRRDGTFHVRDDNVRRLLKGGECFLPGTRVGVARGWRCACGHLSVFRARCGRCGATDLTAEE